MRRRLIKKSMKSFAIQELNNVGDEMEYKEVKSVRFIEVKDKEYTFYNKLNDIFISIYPIFIMGKIYYTFDNDYIY